MSNGNNWWAMRSKRWTVWSSSLPLGINCDTELAIPCSDRPCANGQICQMNNRTGLYACQCPINTIHYRGKCETMESICATKTCFDRGICILDVSDQEPRATCLCSPGYTGLNCEERTLNPCVSRPCGTNGTCIRTLHGSYQCICEDGSIGLSCPTSMLTTKPPFDVKYLPCLENPCHYLSTCQQIERENGTEIKCLCPNYLTGDRCQYANQCQKQPCLNQGTCYPLDALNSFVCQCSAGFGHYDCSICKSSNLPPSLSLNPSNLDLGSSCSANVCLNGGRCEQNSTMIQCLCPTAFAGPRCEWSRRTLTE